MAQTGGYQVGEGTATNPATTSSTGGVATIPPNSPATARFARIEYVSGNVTWRRDATANWTPLKQYTALNAGTQIWAVGEGKVEIRFEDGAIVRLGHGALATLDTLYSDTQGGYTRVALTAGLGMLTLKNTRSVYEVDLPTLTAIASGPSRVRVGADRGAEVSMRAGKAVVQSKLAVKPAKVNINSGDYAAIIGSDTAITVKRLPALDSWDRWNDERDHIPGASYPHLAPGPGVIIDGIILGGHEDGHFHRHW